MIPGINVLGIAFGAIAQQTVQHLSATGRTQNAVGAWVTTYAAPVSLPSSFQPVDAKKYEQLGLDLMKEYKNIWLKTPVAGIQRGASPDRFTYAGRLYEVADVKDWYGQDGWSEVVVIDIGPST
jgi:hypothetical protein